MGWTKVTDTSSLDARRVFPIHVLVAAWYDGQFGRTFVCAAEYSGPGMGFNARGGGPLGDCVVTHWQPMLLPPSEKEMLDVALSGVLT